MTVVVETMIPATVCGTPSGTYDGSSLDWYSIPVKGVNYYRGQGHIQTVWINVLDFQGVITIEANLDQDPLNFEDINYQTSTSWFIVDTFGDASSQITDYRPLTIAGNFTWLRAKITDFTNGEIKRVNVTY